ncbi:S4 domain-containing protein [Cohnella algarum]|uniref:S4 domain-containing protein n=1 Tax=Cohnella algarum TaxID=2044859 RepID=UPI001F085DA3|nr:S4 domain-containing protein [Cohnella algarum]
MNVPVKERLDVLLVELGYFESREKAKAAIMAGLVQVGTERVDKAGTKVPRDAAIVVKGAPHPYVSRGGSSSRKRSDFSGSI